MAWSRAEIIAIQMAKRSLAWNDPQYQLVLRNAGVRPFRGKVSSTNPANDTATFVRVMAICERSGYIDPKKGQGYWIGEAQKTCSRMHHKILALVHAATVEHHLIATGAMEGFIERMTQGRPQGPTRELSDCDWEWTYKILEGLKAWLNRAAKERGISLD